MKTAIFKYQGNFTNPIYGRVTLKDDGKISVTELGMHSTATQRSQAKIYAQEIVAKGFPSDMCQHFYEEVKQTGLIEQLKEHTADLLAAFIEQTRIYANNAYEHHVKCSKRTELEWYEIYRVDHEPSRHEPGKLSPVRDTKNYRRYDDMQSDRLQSEWIVKHGLQALTDKEVANAKAHYDNSIERLAARLTTKGVVEGSKFSITSGRVKQNFECTISHGMVDGVYTKTTRAWTIIASGPIVRPHYRYLVK